MNIVISSCRAALTAVLMTAGAAAFAGEAPDGSAAIPGPGESRQANPGGTTEGVNPAAAPAGKGMGGSAGGTGNDRQTPQTNRARGASGADTTGITPHEAEAMAKGAQKTPTPPPGATQGDQKPQGAPDR